VILRGATILSLDGSGRCGPADIEIDLHGRIACLRAVGSPVGQGVTVLDRTGRIILPGLVQTHLHLCQTLFRGLAEGRRLSRWLAERIWPLEAGHDPGSLRAAARLGLLELIAGGTTAILDMGTTRNTETIAIACEEAGIRAITGSAIMDECAEAPPSLLCDAGETLEETRRLLERFPRGGRVTLCLAPRFLPSVSEKAWRDVAAFAEAEGLLIHTHACETRDETVSADSGAPTVFERLEQFGVGSPKLVAAHGVWLADADRAMLRRTGAAIVHCPGSNAKLGSGTADVLRLRRDGVRVGIGCDGAACNNRLDLWEELRRAAHAMALLHGPETVDPEAVLALATRDGARVLGLEDRIGTIAVGRDADLVVLDPSAGGGLWPEHGDPHARVLYGAGREHVEEVWIRGQRAAHRGAVRGLPATEVMNEASEAARRILARMETSWTSPSN
jgi:5-methylthioadenosine/S-adenosylhomocysteine deaminase